MLALVQCRLTSARLPRKALMKIGGKTIIQRTIDRLQRSSQLSSILITTSDSSSDDDLEFHAAKLGIEVFRGDLQNVCKRLVNAANFKNAENFVRISADSPFIDWRIVDKAIDLHKSSETDLVTNIFPRTYPKGQSVEIIRTDTLNKIIREKLCPEAREHVTTHFYDNFKSFRIISFTSGQNRAESVQCVDNKIDFSNACHLANKYEIDDLDWLEIDRLFNKNLNIVDSKN